MRPRTLLRLPPLPFGLLTHPAVLFLPILLAAPMWAQEDGPESTAEETTVGIEIGGWASDTDGSLDVVSEYEPDEGGPQVGVDLEAVRDWGFLLLDGIWRNEDDQKLDLRFDVGRMVRSKTSYVKLPHRLLHDPLTNLATATNHGRIVQHTDLDPGSEYGIRYSSIAHRTELQMPGAERLTWALDVRNQEREGVLQHLTVSHCDTCHVISQDRPLDQRNTDVGLEGRYNWNNASLRVSYTFRELTQDPAILTLLFDDALQPELRVPIFDNRLQWDSAQGPQPIAGAPDIDKQIARIDLQLPKGVSAGGVWSVTENRFTDLASEFTGVTVAAGHAFPNRVSLRWRGRAYTLDNDEVFVDIAEPVSIAGPHAGLTFQDVYGFDPDFLRLSALDRDVVESRFDVGWRPGGRKAGRFKLLWQLEQVDRDNFAVTDDGKTDTLTNILGISWRGRPGKGWKLDTRYRHGEADHPFANPDGVFSANTGPRVSSPFAPGGEQYFEFQEERIGDASASPESWDELRVSVTRTLANSLVTGSWSWWDGDNTSGDLTHWSKTYQSATISLWSTPAPKWEWFAAFAVHDSELEAPASIPLFDG